MTPLLPILARLAPWLVAAGVAFLACVAVAIVVERMVYLRRERERRKLRLEKTKWPSSRDSLRSAS